MARDLYRWLVAGARGHPADRHLFACILAHALGEGERPLAEALGLSAAQLATLLQSRMPHALSLQIDAGADGEAPLALEEPDLRALLIEHGTAGAAEEVWLAHMLARRSLGANHLWQDLGLTARSDLVDLMQRHFAPLAAKNSRDMKWKKFFYRELCEREGVLICKAPTCDVCCDVAHCFGGEDGEPLGALALSQTRQLSASA